MSRPIRIGLGIATAAAVIVGIGVGYTLLVSARPDIGNPDLATVKTMLVATWDTEDLSRADVIAGLTDEFAAADLESTLTDLGIGDPVHIRITFTADGSASAVAVESGTTHPIGDATYRLIDNHTMVLTRGTCEIRGQFRLRAETLTFGVVDPCEDQIGDVTLGVLLRSAPFTRATES